ncbi:MAG: methylase involved in ubiquinone/menaquinone biosynthesi [Parcubacteria group bacterium Athens0714_24]|nr:MAG: methylase involved in ubiquinone/menaquinone biosynthesi [Parcubacteria group bacterium Athens0714_24]
MFKIFIRETWRGKDLGRILANLELQKKECFGKILDIGGGKGRASHYRFLKLDKNAVVKKADINPDYHPDFLLNIETDKIPTADGTFDFVFALSIIEHLADCSNLFNEARRVLVPAGKFIGAAPFLLQVHPDPHDYVRFTREKLEIIFREAGFKEIKIVSLGRGPFTAAYQLLEFIFPRISRMAVVPVVLFLDKLLQKIKPGIDFKEKYPLGYIFELKRHE